MTSSRVLSLFAIFFFAFGVAISMDSCTSDSPATAKPDTLHLVSSQDSIYLRAGGLDTFRLWITCGCPYFLSSTGQGGDAASFNLIHITSDVRDTTPHILAVEAPAGEQGKTHYDGWLSFAAVDHFGKKQYDTVRLVADLD